MGQNGSTSIQSEEYVKAKLNKTVMDFDSIKANCAFLAEGYQSNTYLHPRLNVVLKIMKKPYLQPILNQINILDQLNPIWPDLCNYQIISKNKIVGFTCKYFQGKKIDPILQDKQNIYHKSKLSRIRLVKKLKLLISKIQQLKICHGDMYYENIIINQPDINSEDCEVFIIDFGNGFLFDQNTRTNAGLNGWKFMVPPQAKKGKKYDPKGVNAYQFGRLALQILLLTSLQDYKNDKIDVDQGLELRRLIKQGYDESVIEQIQGYLSDDLDTRNRMLQGPMLMKEIIYEQNQKE